jgi:hypothetical protein
LVLVFTNTRYKPTLCCLELIFTESPIHPSLGGLTLPILDPTWQVVSMDFITGIPQSCKYKCIMPVVDKFSILKVCVFHSSSLSFDITNGN